MSKTIKIISILLVAIMLVITVGSSVYAVNPDDIIANVVPTNPGASQVSGLQGMASRILGLLQAASAILAIVLVGVFGFKFIMGSPEQKGDYQKSFIALIVGVVVVFSATSVARLIFSIAGTTAASK